MRKLIATVFNYSLDGLLADEGTEFWKFCFDLPENREPDDPAQLDFLRGAYAHIMGRTSYESNGHRPPLRPYPERRAQGRLLPDPEDGRLG
jgi:dihydrofolate reductase